MDKIDYLKQKIQPLADYPACSRVHALKSFSNAAVSCCVKRDDELGFGISGSKIRKYLSLIPSLLSSQIEEAIVIGSAYSNHVLGIIQLLIENNIKPVLFLLGSNSRQYIGNLLLISTLIPKEDIHWVKRDDWPQVKKLAEDYLQQHPKKKIKIIPEGACMPEALAGSITLALDIIHNEEQLQITFNDIFIDAGTGLMAIALILAFAWLEKDTRIHVLLLADAPKNFVDKLKLFHRNFEQLLEVKLSWQQVLERFEVHTLKQVRSFGSVNASVFKGICNIARKEGFITDPIFSAKLFMEAERILKNKQLRNNTLIIHSGGSLSLMGFQDRLLKAL